jgi:tripartite-type tricarboxylate transporter receptor subunit TctC
MRRLLGRLGLQFVVVIVSAFWVASNAHAQDYPNSLIRIISPHPTGVATDLLARAIAPKLGESLGQSVIVENRPGANGIIAAGNVAKAPPDGYTLHITTGAHVANAFVAKNLPYDPIKDFSPVTQLAGSYGLALITNLPVRSVAELIALAKTKPLSYATNGVGNITHVAGLLFEAQTGIKMTAVPYNTPNLTTDVMAGTVDLTFFSTAGAAPLVDSGKIKALAVTGSKRSPSLPNTPTLKELGYKNFDVTGYFGFLFPASTPRDRIDRIYRESLKALSTPEVKRVIEIGGFYVVGSSPDEFTAFLKQDFEYQNRLMDELGLKAK